MRLSFLGKLLPFIFIKKLTEKFAPDFVEFRFKPHGKKWYKGRLLEIAEGCYFIYDEETFKVLQEKKKQSKLEEQEYQKQKKIEQFNKLKKELGEEKEWRK